MSRKYTLVLFVCVITASVSPAAEVDFAREVLPILSENCFHCHGPDEKTRRAALRLDTKDGAFRTRRDRTTIVPGKSAESEVYLRISSADAGNQMPPPESNRKLTPAQVATLKRWIDEGAKWGEHWAYRPLPKVVPVPPIANVSKSSNAIDAFILARLQPEKLSLAPPARPETWLRRVTFDLTGLPPTIAEVEAFTHDHSPNAYEKVVDRLLASPRYGERMAANWLDVARYADTHGYQSDRYRAMWAYRDWVIQAFNTNQPYDRFTIEQLAGDLLPNATKQQQLATAFNRLHMQNEEGGVVEEEFRVAYVVDRVTTFGIAFLAQTFECCRCHDHKFDPLSQKDFYSLFAFFQNIDESGQTSYFTSAMPVPALMLTTAEQDAKLAELNAAIQTKTREFKTAREQAHEEFRNWKAKRPKTVEPVGLMAHFPFDEFSGNRSPNTMNAQQAANGHDGPTLMTGRIGQAAKLNGENGFEIPGVGHFTRSDPFSISLWLKSDEHQPRAVVLHHSRAPIDAGSRGYELLLEEGKVAFGLHYMWPGNSLKIRTTTPISAGQWTHVVVVYDGSSRADGLHLYVDGKLSPTEVIRDGLTKDITYEGGEPNLQIGYRFRDNGFKGGAVDELKFFNRRVTSWEIVHLAGQDATEPGDAALEEYFASTVHKPTLAAMAALREARLAQARFVNPIPDIMVMQELPKPKPAFILKRGAYDSPGEAVTAHTPSVLPSFTAEFSRNRLGLARWLTHPEHPLFARVMVNRLWQQMFGKGLVETSDNFGTTGVPPTHPELLDWLARDFSRDWDIKRALKQMALSATYRQSSQASDSLRQHDPYNHLLARAPIRRLSAEMLRDQALAISGLLVEKLGGPSVYPYQPEGLWNEAMGRPHYPQSKGDDLYRRSVYTIWKRTAPHPQMTTFDAADRSNCAVRRQATTTPNQALALLNDPQIVEAAVFLGQRMLQEGGSSLGDRVTWVFRRTTGRQPSAKERAVLIEAFQEQASLYQKDEASAKKLLTVGERKPDLSKNLAEMAAAAQLALLMLNHDEAVYRR